MLARGSAAYTSKGKHPKSYTRLVAGTAPSKCELGQLKISPWGWPALIKRPLALIKRPLRPAPLIKLQSVKKWLGLAADKLLVRNKMRSAIRNPNLKDLAIWPLPVNKTAIQPWPVLQFLDKTGIGLPGLDKRPLALIKRPSPFSSMRARTQ